MRQEETAAGIDGAPSDVSRSLARILEATPPRSLLTDEDAADDRFGSRDIASRLVPLVRQAAPPFTISVSGAWGVGKTTLTKRVRDLLAGDEVPAADRVPVIEVDLWTEDLGDLRRTLALEVAVGLAGIPKERREEALRKQAEMFDEELRSSITRQEPQEFHWPAIRRHRVRSLVALLVIAVAIFALSSLTLPNDPNNPVDPIGLRMLLTAVVSLGVWILVSSGLVFSVTTSSTSTQPLEEKVGLRRKFKELVSSNQQQAVVIVIDNLDRLAGDDAVRALSEIRSFVEVPGSRCVFLVPIDRDALVRHLARSMGGDDQAARDYLDKFFNLDILLTKPVREDLRAWIRDDLVARLFPGADRATISLVAEVVAEAGDGSPRATKRIVNGIYTRAYLLPVSERHITLPALAFTEGLVVRFPGVLRRLLADPRGWIEALERFRAATSEQERMPELRWLAGLEGIPPSPGDASSDEPDRTLRALRRLLLFPTDIPSEGDLRTILAVRSDRQWANVPDRDEVQAALVGGDGDRLRELFGSLELEGQEDVLRISIDEIRQDREQGWFLGVLRGLNALAAVVPLDHSRVLELRAIADEFLLAAPNAYLRQLTPSSVDLVFGSGLRQLPHGPAIAEQVIGEIAPNPNAPATSLVDIAAVISHEMSASHVHQAAKNMITLTDDELSPLFDREADRRLLLGIRAKYVETLTGWDPTTSSLADIREASRRLRRIKAAGWDDAADLNRIADQARTLIPSLDPDAIEIFDQLVPLFEQADPTPSLDNFAQALAAWKGGGTHALELALDVPATPGPLAAVATSRLQGADLSEFRRLVASREKLRAVGVSVADYAMTRWSNGQGAEYARHAFETGHEDDLARFSRGLALVADETTYGDLLAALEPEVRSHGNPRVAELTLSDIEARVSDLSWPAQARLATVVAGLQALADPAEVVVAVESDQTSSDKTNIVAATAVVQAFVEAGVHGSARLPVAIARHGATIGAIDAARAGWLSKQVGVKRDDLRVGILGAIGDQPAGEILPAVSALRSRLNRAVAIGIALVERGAQESPGDRLPWLQEARDWGLPRKAQPRGAYSAALDQALDGDNGVIDVVRDLRMRLLERN